jgi:hypothetical protein
MLGAVAVLSATVGMACAQQSTGHKPLPANPLEAISQGLKLRADPVEPKDFVTGSRPTDMQYIPTGSPRPQPPSKVMTADQVKAKQAELEAMLVRHDRATGRKPTPVRATTGAAKPLAPAAR